MSFLGKIHSVLFKISKKRSRKNLYEWMEDEISALSKQSGSQKLKILNIGSGGEIYQRLNQINNAQIIQTDIDETRNPDIVADACDMPMFKDGEFDAIFMMEVLEHVNEPWRAIPEINRVLKKEGKFILSTPFIFPLHDEPYDFYRYTKYGLKHLLKDFGQVTIRKRNDYMEAIYVLFARMIMTKSGRLNRIGVIAFIYMLIQWPLLYLLSKTYDNHQATTGYFTTAIKI